MASIFQTSKVKGGRGKVTRPPVFSVAPTSATIPSAGGSIQFTASDPDGGAVTYSLSARYSILITIDSSGLVSVPGSLQGTNGNITVVAMDPTGATTSATCAVSVTAVPVAPVFTVAPTSAIIGSSGGSIQFTATASSTIEYSLAQRYNTLISINPLTGLVDVPSSLAGTNGDIIVQATANGLSTNAPTCAVQVEAVGEARLMRDLNFDDNDYHESGETLGVYMPNGQWVILLDGGTVRPTISTVRSRAGGRASRHTIAYPQYRSELKAGGTGEYAYYGQEYWYGWSIYVVAPYVNDTRWEIFTQFHQPWNAPLGYTGPARTATLNPPLPFEIDGGTLSISSRYYTQASIDANPQNANLWQRVSTGVYSEAGFGAAAAGTWTDFVVNTRWAALTSHNGFLKIYKNGTLIVNVTGQNCYWHGYRPHFKMGIYKGWLANPADTKTSLEMWTDEFRMAKTSDGATYNTVAPPGNRTSAT